MLSIARSSTAQQKIDIFSNMEMSTYQSPKTDTFSSVIVSNVSALGEYTLSIFVQRLRSEPLKDIYTNG